MRLDPQLLGIVLWGLALFSMLGVVFGFTLAAAALRFQVKTNPLVDRVREALPSANCGACGFAGCQAYAEAIQDRLLPDPPGLGGNCAAIYAGNEFGKFLGHVHQFPPAIKPGSVGARCIVPHPLREQKMSR